MVQDGKLAKRAGQTSIGTSHSVATDPNALARPRAISTASSTWWTRWGFVGRGSGNFVLAIKGTVVYRPVPDHFKVPGQPAGPVLAHHGSSVSANQHGFVGDELVVIVQLIGVWVAINRALVHRNLTVIFTPRLQHARELEEAVGDGIELGLPNNVLQHRVCNFDLRDGEHSWICKTHTRGNVHEVPHIKSSSNAFTPEKLVLLNVFGEPPVAVHIRKVQFSSLGQDPVCFPKHPGLVGRQVDDAVGDDDVDGLVRDPSPI
eukprot:scaffold3009_cov605-Pavlova_lutheri.AAC.1